MFRRFIGNQKTLDRIPGGEHTHQHDVGQQHGASDAGGPRTPDGRMGFQQAVYAAGPAHTGVADGHGNAAVRGQVAVQLHGRPVHEVGADVRRGAQDVPDNQREDGRQQGLRVRRVSEQGVRDHGQMRSGRQGHRRFDARLRLVGRQSHYVRIAPFEMSVRRQVAQVVQGHERIPEGFRQSRQPAVLSGER